MTKTESTIRFLFGASRKDIRPLVHAVDITIKLMFSQGIPMDESVSPMRSIPRSPKG